MTITILILKSSSIHPLRLLSNYFILLQHFILEDLLFMYKLNKTLDLFCHNLSSVISPLREGE